MSSSINNNLQAQLALSILNTTISDLQATQEQVVSGQKVNNPHIIQLFNQTLNGFALTRTPIQR